MPMNPRELRQRIAQLSPERRAALERRLLESRPPGGAAPGIPRHASGGPPALSFAQQRLWFLDQFEPGSSAYNIPTALRLSGPLDVEALRRALETIVARHEPLRTTIRAVDGTPVQIIAEPPALALPLVDLTTVPDPDREAELQQRLDAEAQRPFDLARDVMLRAILFRFGPQEHVLSVVMHHIASDGWSMGVFFKELNAGYGTFVAGRDWPLPPLPIQYADYAVWQREWLRGAALQAQIAYWKDQLAGTPAALELPTDFPRPPMQTFKGARETMLIPPGLVKALQTVGRRDGATLFMTVLAAFQVLLHRYSGEDDIVVGSPIAGRTRVELEGLLGFFVNTLVLRARCGGNPTFREFLGGVREAALGAFAHQDIPFERLVEEVQPARSLDRSPLFQVFFALQNPDHAGLALPGLVVRGQAVHSGTEKFDLSLYLIERADGLRVACSYNTALFAPATIRRLLEHYHTLLAGIAADPDARLADLPVLTAAERMQILVEWTATQAAYPSEACLHHLIAAQAVATPDAVAVVYEDQALSYRELDARANQLAHHLRGLGVGPGVLVGLCVERSLEMVVGLLAILKAGGAYLPLDPTFPRDRLAFIVADARVSILVTQDTLRSALPDHEARMVRLDADRAILAAMPETPPDGGQPEDLAYVLYTSGSTGRPKGVQIPHRAVVNFLASMRREPGLAPDDVLLAVTTLSFDIAGLELFLPLLVGARVVIVSSAVAADGHRLARTLAESGATVMQATPATWRMLLEVGWEGSPRLRILCGGEALPRDLAQTLLARGASLWNLYGPTETTIWSTVHRVADGVGPVCIGRPIVNTRLYILDRYGMPAAIGVPGELYIGGDGLASGYLNRPELTAEKFVAHPFDTGGAARLYRTGDRARYRPDGTVEFLGRLDHQVKLRGYRIELGEIEAVLREHPGVRDAVVTVREDQPGDQRLVAYIVPEGDDAPPDAKVLAALRSKLPGYMIPAALVPLAVLPLTPNGKVDRRALPPSDGARTTVPAVAPRDLLEVQLVKLWQEVLGVPAVGIEDNFFALGGHSLLAVRLFDAVARRTGRQLPLAALFQAPTVAALARILRQDGWLSPWEALVPIQPGGKKPPLFCVHQHTGHLFCYQALGRHLGSDQPVFGLSARGVDGQAPPRAHIEEMAAAYVKEIRQLQPDGPYHLAGYCFGGTVAYEMACQLRAQGQRVGLLALIESYRGRLVVEQSGRIMRWVERLSFEWGKLAHLPLREKLRTAAVTIADDVAYRARRVLEIGRGKLGRTLGRESYVDRAVRAVEAAHINAMRHYSSKTYPDRVDLFRAARLPFARRHDPTLGWGGLAAGLVVHEIESTRPTLVEEPPVLTLSAQLSRLICGD